jgi:hypothetical protein
LDWIERLRTSGCTHFRPAMTEATKLSEVTDIVTLCDGGFNDSTHFDFLSVARSFPKVKFHFVAVGEGAETKIMMEYAAAGRGHYQYEC